MSFLAWQEWAEYARENYEPGMTEGEGLCILCGDIGPTEDYAPYCSWRCAHEDDEAADEELYATWLRLRAPLSPLVDLSGEGKEENGRSLVIRLLARLKASGGSVAGLVRSLGRGEED